MVFTKLSSEMMQCSALRGRETMGAGRGEGGGGGSLSFRTKTMSFVLYIPMIPQ